MTDIVGEPLEIPDGRVCAFLQCNTIVGLFAEGVLHEAKEVPGAWESNGHGSEFAQDTVPFLHTRPFLGGRNGFQDFLEAFLPVHWQCDGHQFGVDDPSQDGLGSGPGAVSLPELF